MRLGWKLIGSLVFAVLAVAVGAVVGLIAAFVYIESRPSGTNVTLGLMGTAALLMFAPPLATAIAMVFYVREAFPGQTASPSNSAAKLTVGLTLALAFTPVAIFTAGCIGCSIAANAAQFTVWRSPSFDTSAGIVGFGVGAVAAFVASVVIWRLLSVRRRATSEPPG